MIEFRNFVLTSLNVHRILITSVLLSTKVFDDEFYKNAYYAKLGGVSTSEMNSLELEFLTLVCFDITLLLLFIFIFLKLILILIIIRLILDYMFRLKYSKSIIVNYKIL